MSLLDSDCLKLNKQWVPVSVISVRKAFSDAAAGAVTLLRFSDGYPTPYRLEDWLQIEAAEGEDSIMLGTSLRGTRNIKVPRVAICTSFDKIISKEQKLNTLPRLAKHYNYTCAVTGKKLKPNEYSREHVRPLSKGGRRSPDNEVLMDKRLNNARGNKSYRKLGLRKPRARKLPRAMLPFAGIVNKNSYKEWDLFLPHARTTVQDNR